MPEHWIPRAHLHEDLLELYRRDNEEVVRLDPIPDDKDRVYVVTRHRGIIHAAYGQGEPPMLGREDRNITVALDNEGCNVTVVHVGTAGGGGAA